MASRCSSDRFCSSRICWRLSRSFDPVAEGLARIEQQALPVVEPLRQRLAQLEVVIDHRREHPLHQVVRALRRLAGKVDEARLHLRDRPAVRRAHGDEQPVEVEERHRPRDDLVDSRLRRQPAEHHDLVGVGVVEERRMREVLRVDDVDVDDAHAGQALDLGLHRVDLVVGEVEPREALLGEPLVGRHRRDGLAGFELPEIHRSLPGRRRAQSRETHPARGREY